MEKIAHKIERLLQKKLSLYQELQSILELEKTYVVDMDIDSLWVTISKKKSLVLAIENVKQEIICLLSQGYSGLNMDAEPFSLSYVIKLLNVSSEKKAELEKLHLAVNTCKKEIARQASDNKNYIHEYLNIINGVFSTVLEGADKKGYNHSGTVLHDNGKNRLLHAQV